MQSPGIQIEAISSTDELVPEAPPSLDADGERAAGWLSESLSQPEAPAPGGAPSVAGISQSNRNTFGDRLLNSLQSVGDAYKAKAAEALEPLDAQGSEMMSFTHILRLQIEFTAVAMNAEAVTKGIGKLPQQVDQLARTQ
jgi:hypothetical protein